MTWHVCVTVAAAAGFVAWMWWEVRHAVRVDRDGNPIEDDKAKN